MLSLHAATQEVVGEQVSLVLGPNFVISFQEGIAGMPFDPIRGRLRTSKGRVRREGADYLVYSLIDAIGGRLFWCCSRSSREQIELLDERMLTNRRSRVARTIHLRQARNDLVAARQSGRCARWSAPATRRISLVARPPLCTSRTCTIHTIEVIDTVETYRDVLSGHAGKQLCRCSPRA